MRDGIEDVVREKERAKLRYPFEHGPQVGGAAVDVAPGVKWLRMPLGGALSFINVWAIEDNGRSGEDAWAIVDTGMGGAATRDAWRAAFAGPLAGKPVGRVFVTRMI